MRGKQADSSFRGTPHPTSLTLGHLPPRGKVTKAQFIINIRFIGLNSRYTIARNQEERRMAMYQLRNVRGHIQVYDWKGNFLFSADSEREAREELKDYAESAA